jgi:hypothetical protein
MGSCAKSVALLVVGQQPDDTTGECIGVTWRDYNAGVADLAGHTSDAEGNDRRAYEHGLQYHQREGVIARRERDDIETSHMCVWVGTRAHKLEIAVLNVWLDRLKDISDPDETDWSVGHRLANLLRHLNPKIGSLTVFDRAATPDDKIAVGVSAVRRLGRLPHDLLVIGD